MIHGYIRSWKNFSYVILVQVSKHKIYIYIQEKTVWLHKTEVIESNVDDGRWFFEKKGRSKFTVRSRSGCLTRYNIYIYLLLSHLLCTDAHLCLQKKEKRTPSVQARKLEISPNFFYIYSVSKLRAHVPHSCVYARIHAAGKVEEWGGRRDTVAFSTLQPMQQWRLGIGGSSSAQCAADVFI